MSPRRACARPGLVALLFVVLALPLAGAARGQNDAGGGAILPAVGFLNDRAGVFDEASRAKLEGFLDQVQRKTGTQFAVLVVDSTAPEEPAAYKTRVFKAWGIGNAERDDGLLMLVALQEHRVEFETGYGLEGTLTDAFEARVVREVMAPAMRGGDVPGGITQGVLAVSARMAKAKDVTLEWDGKELRYRSRGGSRLPLPIVIALILLFVLVAVGGGGFGGPTLGRRHRGYGGWGGYGGGWGGGFGGGGGGFSGGGGSFGGFGGGSSGGGGGGGSW
jgi:uncharacterized protein